MIALDRVFKSYSAKKGALNDVSFQLPDGAFGFLTGHSGAGKSTLLKLLAAIELCTRGQVLLWGQNLRRMSSNQIARARQDMGLVFQSNQLLFDRNVYDNVALPLLIGGFRRRAIAPRVRAALNTVDLMQHERSLPQNLSGGEQQRVGIARAIVNRPKLLLADEPTGNLDPQLSAEIMHLFYRLNRMMGTTVLIATHDIPLIESMNKPRLVLHQGALVRNDFAQAN